MAESKKEDRIQFIKEIEKERKSRLLIYITGDRRSLETRIAGDIIPIIYEQLILNIGSVDNIDLYIYTAGGDSLAGWAIVNIIREFCKKFNVIIPFKCNSCGTLISLGANEILMAKGGQLSPVDPSLASPYNPPAPGQTVQLLPVSVEDVLGYLKLAKEEAGIKGDEGLGQVMKILSEKVNPMALGAVYRSKQQIRLLAERLLSNHEKDGKKIADIVEKLTEKLPSHQYLISRKEAKELFSLKIVEPEDKVEKLIYDLYKEYEKWFEIRMPYNPETVLGTNPVSQGLFDRGVVKSLRGDSLKTYVYRTEKELKRVQGTQPGVPFPIVGVQERIIREGWVEI